MSRVCVDGLGVISHDPDVYCGNHEYRSQVWVQVLSRQNLCTRDTDRPSLARGVAECKNEDYLYHECKILPRKHE